MADTMTSAFLQECQQVFSDNGLVPPAEFIADGHIHRCATTDKVHGKDGAYIVHLNTGLNTGPKSSLKQSSGLGSRHTLWWQNHRTGDSGTHVSTSANGQSTGDGSAKTMTEAEHKAARIALAEHMETSRQRRQEEQEQAYAHVAAKAQDIWDNAKKADDDFPYLFHKDVCCFGLKMSEDGRLIVPLLHSNGAVQSLQFIAEDGDKRFLTGGKKQGGFFPLAAKNGEKNGPLCIAEGYATAASVRMSTGHACLVAFDAGNLLPVAKLARALYPERTIILCADNDTGPNKTLRDNVGVMKATEAALAVGALIAIPVAHNGQASDFNDMMYHRGMQSVQAIVEQASYAAELAAEQEMAEAQDALCPPALSTLATHATQSQNVGQVVEVEGPAIENALPLRRPPKKQAPYPVDALGVYGEAATAVAEKVGAPLSMVANSILGMLSLATQDIAVIEHDGRIILPSLYLLSIVSSGERKSTVDAIVMQAVREHERSLDMQYNEDIKAWRIDSHAHEIAKRNISKGKNYASIREELASLGDEPKKPMSPSLIVSNINIEGLYKLYQDGATSLGLICDEGGILFGGTAFSSENKLKSIASLSSLWSSGSSDKVRMGEGMSRIHDKRLSCHIMLQPIIAEPLFSDPILQEQGFLPRFLLSWPESLKGTRIKNDIKQYDIREHSAVRAMYQDCHKLLQFPRGLDGYGNRRFIPLPLSNEAIAIYNTLYNTTEFEQRLDGALHDVSNYASRCGEQALRIAAVLSLAKDPVVQHIDGDCMQRGASIALWYLAEAQRIMDNGHVSPEIIRAEKLLRWLKKKDITVLTQRLVTRLGPLREGADVKKALELLLEYRYLTPMPKGTVVHGKPSSCALRVLAYEAG